uniref:Uncharacterized protein n=1 Tax=Romanomermis culicivorax TaxID=13658 RepID=A0A915K929_ROMCU
SAVIDDADQQFTTLPIVASKSSRLLYDCCRNHYKRTHFRHSIAMINARAFTTTNALNLEHFEKSKHAETVKGLYGIM